MKIEKNTSLRFYIKFASIGFLIASLFSVVLFLISTLVFVKSKTLPIKHISSISFFLILIACFLSSLLTAKFAKAKGLFLGLIIGLVSFIVLLILGYITLHEINTPVVLIRGIAIIITSSIGGIIGVNKNKKRRKI